MAGFRQIVPDRLIFARGDRSRSDIVRAGSGAFSEQDLYNWEKGKNRPLPERVPFLLKALGVTYEVVSEEVTTEMAA